MQKIPLDQKNIRIQKNLKGSKSFQKHSSQALKKAEVLPSGRIKELEAPRFARAPKNKTRSNNGHSFESHFLFYSHETCEKYLISWLFSPSLIRIWQKNVDFLLMANFQMCPVSFDSDFTNSMANEF